MQLTETPIKGCYEILPLDLKDHRGRFVKPYHFDTFRDARIDLVIREEYFSVSRQGVLRGLHFQLPPMATAKLVSCLSGSLFDAVVDLRTDSPTYLQYFTLELSKEKGNLLYIPKGLAHGFCALSADALMLYMCSQAYSPEHDTGLRWDSAGIPWPVEDPEVSDKDRGLMELSKFESPFRL